MLRDLELRIARPGAGQDQRVDFLAALATIVASILVLGERIPPVAGVGMALPKYEGPELPRNQSRG